LVVADPCYVQKPAGGLISLAVAVTARPGVWHAFLRNGELSDADRTAELVVIHKDGFGAYATERIGWCGVDSGTAGVFDKECPKARDDEEFAEGIQRRFGAAAWSGYGDG